MKALFLDFDGVITTHRTRYRIDLARVSRVMDIINATGAKIVVTSSWKHGHVDVDSFKKELLECDSMFIPDELKGNPLWKRFIDSIVDITDTAGSLRGDDIKKYIDDNDVEEYCILDDDSDMLEEQLFHFVQTDVVFGISDRDAELCVEILNGIEVVTPTRMNQVLTTMWRNHCRGEKNGIYDMLYKYKAQFMKVTENIV